MAMRRGPGGAWSGYKTARQVSHDVVVHANTLRMHTGVLVTPTPSPQEPLLSHQSLFVLVRLLVCSADSCAHRHHLACLLAPLCSLDPSSSSWSSPLSSPPLRRIASSPLFSLFLALVRRGLMFDTTSPRCITMNFVQFWNTRMSIVPCFWQLYYTTFRVCFSLRFGLVHFTPTRPVLSHVHSLSSFSLMSGFL
jgi:hypothetical protein